MNKATGMDRHSKARTRQAWAARNWREDAASARAFKIWVAVGLLLGVVLLGAYALLPSPFPALP